MRILAYQLGLEGCELGVRVVALCAEVELDLRFGTGRPDGHHVTGLVEELEDIGLWLSSLLRLEIVNNSGYLGADELCRRVLAEVSHHLLDFLGSGLALAHY